MEKEIINKNTLEEEWRWIDWLEDYYEISNHWNIRSITRYVNAKCWKRLHKWKILKTFYNRIRWTHFFRIKVSDENIDYNLPIEETVYKTFVWKIQKWMVIRHIDWNINNNYFKNLKQVAKKRISAENPILYIRNNIFDIKEMINMRDALNEKIKETILNNNNQTMKLTPEQKETLKSLTKHPWFAILEKLEEEALNNLGRQMFKLNLEDEKQKELFKNFKIYAEARQDFLDWIKKQTLEVYENEIKLY